MVLHGLEIIDTGGIDINMTGLCPGKSHSPEGEMV